MKELTVKNLNTIEAKRMKQGDSEFYVKPVVFGKEVDQCEVSFVEIPPKNQSFGYHYHEKNEEVFYIISGVGAIRTPNGEKTVKSGDIITFPTGEENAHAIRNTSDTETLVYIDFDTNNIPELVHFLDTNKIMVVGNHIKGMFTKE